MFQIPVQNLDNIRKARKKVKDILVDLGLDSCRELVKNLKSFDAGENYFRNTSWSDVSPWEPVGKRKRYRTKPYCCSLCKFSSKFLTSFKNHLHRYHEDEMDQEMVVSCPKCAFSSHPKVVGKHIRMFHSSNKRIQNYTVSILDGMKQFRSDIINFTCLKCQFTDTLYYNMKKHVLMNHFKNLVCVYFGEKCGESTPNSVEFYCKKCNAPANSPDSLMFHVLTAETHRDLENKLRSLISEHIKKPGFVKQMYIAPKLVQGVAAAAPSAGLAAVPTGSVTAPACIQVAFPQTDQNQSTVQTQAVQNTVGPVTIPSASGSLPQTTSAPTTTSSHVALVPSNPPMGQNNVGIQPPPSQPIIISHGLPLNHSVGTITRTVAPAVLPLNQPVRPGIFPVNPPIGTINSPVPAGTLPVTQPVDPVNQPVAPGVLPVNQPVAPGVLPVNQPVAPGVLPVNQPVGPGILSVNQSLGNMNRPIDSRVLPVAQTVGSGVLQLNQPVAPGVVPVRQPVGPGFLQLNQPVAPAVIPVNQPVQPPVSQSAAFLTAGSILRQLIPTGRQVNGIPTYTLAPISVTLPVSPGGGVATVTPPQVPIQLMQSGSVTQLSQSPASAPSPPVVLTSENVSLQASPPAPETSQAVRQAKQWKTCPVCNELFPSNVYEVHMEVAHKPSEVKVETPEPHKLAACAPFLRMTEKAIRCYACKCFLCEEELMKHIFMHGLSCLFCTGTFYDLKSLVEHNKTAHNGRKQLHASYSNRGIQLGNDAQGGLVFPHFDFNTVLPDEDMGEREVHLAVLVGIYSTILVPVYIKVKPQTAQVNRRCTRKMFTCPFCLGTFAGRETYEKHLKERHHIMPTVHTILKSPAFKCIHCCGVYTGNMTLTAIAVHLLRCRSAPKDTNSSLKMQLERTERKELLFVNGEKHISVVLKRKQSDSCFVAEDQRNKEQQPLSLSTGIGVSPENEVNSGVVPFKRQKIRTEMRKLPSSEDLRFLAVDPNQYDHNSYEAQKQFLSDYFHKRPYPSKKEVELLSLLLYAWKIDVASFFGKMRNTCLKAIKHHRPSVLMGFSMSELKNIKHSLNLKDGP
ncbi:ADNP2 protein, partial [Pachycephala philippinensis]|nr:ADNP2 protein [Pachycephala philippinensis]